MDGIPASKSTTALTTEAILLPLKYSPLNNAIESEKGIQNNKANREVMSVPVIKGSAPKLSFTESQLDDVIKLKKPNTEKASILLDTKA